MKATKDVLIIAEPHFTDYNQFRQRVAKFVSAHDVVSGVHDMVGRYIEEKGNPTEQKMENPDLVIVFWDNKYEPVRLEMNKWLGRGKKVLLTNTARDYWKE